MNGEAKAANSGGIYFGYGISVVCIILMSIWSATQFVAFRLCYSSILGEPLIYFSGVLKTASLFTALGLGLGSALSAKHKDKTVTLILLAFLLFFLIPCFIPLYRPWQFFSWYFRLNDTVQMSDVWKVGCLVIIIPSQFAFVAAWILGAKRAKEFSKPSETHGSAHFASYDEIKNSGLFSEDGVYLGCIECDGKWRYLKDNGAESMLVVAPSRAGKGVGIVIPTLLSWKDSVFVNDIKGENWAHTAGYRKEVLGQKCIRFAPLEESDENACYNPLLEVRPWPHDVKDAQNLAKIICDPEGATESRYWDASAWDLMCAVILHVLYAGEDKTLTGCLNLLSDPARPIELILQDMMFAEHDPDGQFGWKDPHTKNPVKTHPVVSRIARSMLNKADREFSGVLGTLVSFLALYRDPIVSKNISHCDFTCRDLMFNPSPVSLYLVIAPEDLLRAKPLIRLLITQITHRLTEKMEFGEGKTVHYYNHRLLFMLDEFAALGKLDFFQSALAYLPGYGIKSVLVAQEFAQLYAAYTKNEAIVGNCRVKVAFSPNKVDTAKMLSDMCGQATHKKQVRTYTGGRFSVMLNHVMAAEHESQRLLLTPDEVMRLEDDKSLIFVSGLAPIKSQKIRFYSDPKFKDLVKAVPKKSDRLDTSGDAWNDSIKGGCENITLPSDVGEIIALQGGEGEKSPAIKDLDLHRMF